MTEEIKKALISMQEVINWIYEDFENLDTLDLYIQIKWLHDSIKKILER